MTSQDMRNCLEARVCLHKGSLSTTTPVLYLLLERRSSVNASRTLFEQPLACRVLNAKRKREIRRTTDTLCFHTDDGHRLRLQGQFVQYGENTAFGPIMTKKRGQLGATGVFTVQLQVPDLETKETFVYSVRFEYRSLSRVEHAVWLPRESSEMDLSADSSSPAIIPLTRVNKASAADLPLHRISLFQTSSPKLNVEKAAERTLLSRKRSLSEPPATPKKAKSDGMMMMLCDAAEVYCLTDTDEV